VLLAETTFVSRLGGRTNRVVRVRWRGPGADGVRSGRNSYLGPRPTERRSGDVLALLGQAQLDVNGADVHS
jgi:hypothetical protein